VTYFVDEDGDIGYVGEFTAELDPEPERHAPVIHLGNVWQDPAGFYVAACDCGWRDTTWTSMTAAADKLKRHKRGNP
jgi:hypothetical protein